ncbi:MAG: hypothetical protein ACRD0L_14050 [Acidimicrobiales bacterium]
MIRNGDPPIPYSQAVAADGLEREPALGVTRLGTGVVIHTQPTTDRRLPIVFGYADGRGQWYRDGRRNTETPTPGEVEDIGQVALYRVGQTNLPTPERMQVIALDDPVVEAHDHRPGSPYVEAVWLELLGPSATWTWQRAARQAAARPSSVVDMADLATSLGLGNGLGTNAPLSRTLGRLVWFDAARGAGDTLAVRVALPDVAARRLARLSVSARLAHNHLAARVRHSVPPAAEPMATLSPAGVGL